MSNIDSIVYPTHELDVDPSFAFEVERVFNGQNNRYHAIVSLSSARQALIYALDGVVPPSDIACQITEFAPVNVDNEENRIKLATNDEITLLAKVDHPIDNPRGSIGETPLGHLISRPIPNYEDSFDLSIFVRPVAEIKYYKPRHETNHLRVLRQGVASSLLNTLLQIIPVESQLSIQIPVRNYAATRFAREAAGMIRASVEQKEVFGWELDVANYVVSAGEAKASLLARRPWLSNVKPRFISS
ncbi:MAG: hypothetical protein AAB459_00750 [Patescibacteria group bacterium]